MSILTNLKVWGMLIFALVKQWGMLSGESGKGLVCRFRRLCSCRDVDFDEFEGVGDVDFCSGEAVGDVVWREWERFNRVK